MKKSPIYKGAGINGKDYYTIVVDKVNGKLFATCNLLSEASEKRYLLDRLVSLTVLNINKVFSFYPCGQEINLNAIPKKYWKYEWINDLSIYNTWDKVATIY
jgi:hypothetical protein